MVNDAVKFSAVVKRGLALDTEGQILHDSTSGRCLEYSVHGISQARTLEWVVMPSSRGSSQHKDQTHVSCISRWILYH